MSVLSPQDRQLYLESLRPPTGYHLDTAVGTTYSLDLLTLLVTPLGFTMFDLDLEQANAQQGDPLEILEAIRNHADRITLFCQAGRIAVPSRHRLLFHHLEPRVVEATAPLRDRNFHPKVWVLRYVSSEGPVQYRLLCLSRNLTFDRCWDTILVMDGALNANRVRDFPRSRPLAEFIGSLPGMAVRPLTPAMLQDVEKIAGEVGRVAFDQPVPFDDFAFWPLGHSPAANKSFLSRIDEGSRRSLVISPFLSSQAVQRVAGTKGPNILISRQTELDLLPARARAPYQDCYAFTSQNTLKEEPDAEAGTQEGVEAQGLHAKVLVLETGKATSVFTGSANATRNGFEGNVEFVVELIGRSSKCGIDLLMSKQPGSASLLDLLVPYEPPEEPVADDADARALEEALDGARDAIAGARWRVQVEAAEGGDGCGLAVQPEGSHPAWNESLAVSVRPLSLHESVALPVELGTTSPIRFHAVAMESLTSFLVFTVSGRRGAQAGEVAFVVNADLVGAPANRREQLLRHLLRDRAGVLRFLLLLLADLSDDPLLATAAAAREGAGADARSAPSPALLEMLLRALDRDEGRLDAVERLLRDLRETDGGEGLVPEGLHELFQAVWAARREVPA